MSKDTTKQIMSQQKPGYETREKEAYLTIKNAVRNAAISYLSLENMISRAEHEKIGAVTLDGILIDPVTNQASNMPITISLSDAHKRKSAIFDSMKEIIGGLVSLDYRRKNKGKEIGQNAKDVAVKREMEKILDEYEQELFSTRENEQSSGKGGSNSKGGGFNQGI